jgi:hypothetical protein
MIDGDRMRLRVTDWNSTVDVAMAEATSAIDATLRARSRRANSHEPAMSIVR